MRVLVVHNRYLSRGGEDESRELEDEVLRAQGHELHEFVQSNERIAQLGSLRSALRTVWSREAYARVYQLLHERRYDVLDVHNTFPLISPSVYYAARACKVPVVQTLHNYRLICPNAILYRAGRVCEDCVGTTPPWPGVVHGCYRGSRTATAVTAAMLTFHRILRTWTQMVDVYVCLTEFARGQFVRAGLPADRIIVKPHFVSPDPGVGDGLGGFALFVGRLSQEKGIGTLLAAWRRLGRRLPLVIVGDGPLAPTVADAARRMPRVDWLGRRPLRDVLALMGRAAMLVFPSEWYETFGRVAVEAFATGTPVVASDIGAISELVAPGRNGLLFRPGDPDDLAEKVEWLLGHPDVIGAMRVGARHEFEAKYTAERGREMLLATYERAILAGGSR